MFVLGEETDNSSFVSVCLCLSVCPSVCLRNAQNLEGELGQYPIDTNLEGELSIYPIDTNLEGELGQYPIDTNLEGELGQYPIDTNLEGELSIYPIDTVRRKLPPEQRFYCDSIIRAARRSHGAYWPLGSARPPGPRIYIILFKLCVCLSLSLRIHTCKAVRV
jgi:hypothetical protein